MAVTTTGSTVLGLVHGLANTLPSFASGNTPAGIGRVFYVVGNPDGVVTGVPQSGIAQDKLNQELYMNKTNGGSTWIHLGSVA